ncbi:MAG: hypothetical protein ABI162_01165 [Luteolibacter sp.]
MADTAIHRLRLMNTPEWVFPWRGRKKGYFTMIFAHLLVGAGFAILLGTVRVKIISPKPKAPRKASLIYLADDAQGRALALQAKEGGPFPARFDPSEWEGMAALQAEVVAATRRTSQPYVPTLRELPEDGRIQPMELATKGETVFPKRIPATLAAPDPTKLKLAPTLFPLSGVPADALPGKLPPFSGVVDGEMTTAAWRFLIRLNSKGGVMECVSLEKGGEKGALELETWLRGIQFHAAPGKLSRWIAVGIGFNNQPVDGPDAH